MSATYHPRRRTIYTSPRMEREIASRTRQGLSGEDVYQSTSDILQTLLERYTELIRASTPAMLPTDWRIVIDALASAHENHGLSLPQIPVAMVPQLVTDYMGQLKNVRTTGRAPLLRGATHHGWTGANRIAILDVAERAIAAGLSVWTAPDEEIMRFVTGETQ